MMKAVILEDPKKGVEFKEIPIPKPGKGEVLVKMICCPIQPVESLMSIPGMFKAPYILDPEGSGIVTEVGEGVDKSVIGKKIFVGSSLLTLDIGTFGGTMCEYLVKKFPSKEAYLFDPSIPHEKACGMYGQPLTAYGLSNLIEKHKCVVVSAAASSISKILVRLLKKKGITVINIVRSEKSMNILKGEPIVLNSSSPSYKVDLKAAIEKYKPTLFYNSVCDDISRELFDMMAKYSIMIVYGALANKMTMEINVFAMLLGQKIIKGYHWSYDDFVKSPEEALKEFKMVEADLMQKESIYDIPVVKSFPIAEYKQAIDHHWATASEGRVIIKIS